jgi:drug/metabolite transporter (DMT)-like permease
LALATSPSRRGVACALAAAALFGLSAPVGKRLLEGAGPLELAALFYLGAGVSLLAWRRIRGARGRVEAPLRRGDFGLLAVITVVGGLVGPVLMLVGLSRVSALSGALLLNLEAPLTILLAMTLFGEHLGRRALAATLLILAGAALLGYRPGGLGAPTLGALAVAAACLGWALDNNLTQRLSLRDPVAVAAWKTLGAGAGNLALALALGHRLPRAPLVAAALGVGALSYGASIVLDAYALRLLGAAREAAWFATAPFFGALGALPLAGDRFDARTLGAMGLMAVGAALLARERHGHVHTHEAVEHEHVHVHDEHHRHAHPDGDVREPHSHRHQHAPLTHDHPHLPDAHHRHRH